MGIDVLIGAFLHHRQHQLGESEKLDPCAVIRILRLTVARAELAVKGLARQFAHLDGIVPVDAEDHALGLDLVLDLRGFAGIILEAAHGAALREVFAGFGFASTAGAGRFARKRAR